MVRMKSCGQTSETSTVNLALRGITTEKDIEKAKFELLEFDRLTQSPNDATAIKYRLNVLNAFLDA